MPKAVGEQFDKLPIFSYLKRKRLAHACGGSLSPVESECFQKLQNYLQCLGSAWNQRIARLRAGLKGFTARHCH